MTVIVYQAPGQHRSRVVCQAMFEGIRRCGDRVRLIEDNYPQQPDADVAVMYGMQGDLFRLFNDYVAAGRKAVYIDLGYWGRREGGRWTGYHKVSVNSRHPTAYFQRKGHDGARLRHFGLHPQPWRQGKHILIAGMGHKTASVGEPAGGEWETQIVAEIRKHSDLPIVYRPKPSWKTATPIAGTVFSPQNEPLEDVLRNASAVVTHHSNVAVDGLVDGIPAFCWHGVASVMASQDLARLRKPHMPEGREQWMRDIAYCQWSVDEMRQGLAWRHLKDEGLL
jgi:hypothetical protein